MSRSKKVRSVFKKNRTVLIMTVAVFASIGVYSLIMSMAATFSASIEPENSSRSAPVTVVDNSTASGGKAVRFGALLASDAYSDSNPPWVLKAGESLMDNVPTNVAIINYTDFANSSRSFTQTMDKIRESANAPYYVRMPAGTFHITDFHYGNGPQGYGAGYQDITSEKYFAGIIGAGADKTFIVVDPNSLSSSQVSAVASGNPSPVQVKAIYAGNGTQPTIFSGITFRGNFQQTTNLSQINGTAPAPYEGLWLTYTRPGSMIQYSRFQGFGFAAKSSPPYETGSITSTHASYTIKRVEIDGRLAKEINSAQPVAAGGLMQNYETNVKEIDSWLHHSRRSGWAIHDHAPSEGSNANDNGAYYGENFQVENVSNTPDNLAGTSLGFPNSNVEEVRNSMIYVRPRFKFSASGEAHIIIATSNGNAMAKTISVADPVITDTEKGGCLIIRIIRQPNSDGIGPYYSAYQSGGFGALPIKVTKNGIPLTPVRSDSYNPAIHTPDKYYVVIMG